MRRRDFIAIIAGATVWPFSAARPQGTMNRTRRIGLLIGVPAPKLIDAFEQGLRDHGWRTGENLTIVVRSAEGYLERLPTLAAELVELKVDLIFAATAPETHAARLATKSIPIVFAAHGDPVGSGDVQSLARPGGNITGLTQIHPELSQKQLQFLRECVPAASRIAVLWNATSPAKARDWEELKPVAQALGILLQPSEVRGPADFDDAFAVIASQRPDALLTLGDPLTYHFRTAIVAFAAAQRLPAMYPFREFVDAGGLMSYGAHLADLFRRAAGNVDKILNGAKPEEIPVERPTKFELTVNLKIAKALGLTIPTEILVAADEVIE
jgi:putative ABC transport system substrate-binding protein